MRAASVLAVAALAACAPTAPPAKDACARTEGDGVAVIDVWVRPAAEGGTSAVYATICNRGATDDALIGVSSPAAAAAELHASSRSADGVSSMAPLARLPLPARGSAALEPGAAHVMLIGLKGGMAPGSVTSVTFEFAHAPPLTVAAPAKADVEDHSGH